jgi:hypothetical protein
MTRPLGIRDASAHASAHDDAEHAGAVWMPLGKATPREHERERDHKSGFQAAAVLRSF